MAALAGSLRLAAQRNCRVDGSSTRRMRLRFPSVPHTLRPTHPRPVLSPAAMSSRAARSLRPPARRSVEIRSPALARGRGDVANHARKHRSHCDDRTRRHIFRVPPGEDVTWPATTNEPLFSMPASKVHNQGSCGPPGTTCPAGKRE